MILAGHIKDADTVRVSATKQGVTFDGVVAAAA
jgi:hypothetical protein